MRAWVHSVLWSVFLVVSLCWSAPSGATKIAPLPVEELLERSSHVVIGEVTAVDVERDGDTETRDITVRIGTTLEGDVPDDLTEFELELQVHGKKAFDPPLEKGDVCVFFLDELTAERASLTHWGSIAKIEGGSYLYTLDAE